MTGIVSDEYKELAQSICAVLFLGTPHEGAALADVLVRFHGIVGRDTEPYLRALTQNSDELQKLNMAFKDILSHYSCRNLHVASFYETEKMQVGLSKKV